MRRIFKTIEDHLTECTTLEKGVWVHLQSPTKEEVDGLTTRFNLDPTFLPAALDEEESARIDYDSDKQQTLIIVDIPYGDTEGTGYVYSTIPLGIVLCDEVIITVCTRDTPIINDFTEERIRNFWTFKRTRFILQILQRNAGRFLSYLKQIDKTSQHIQEKLEHTSRNQELLQMMKLEKSLVYFNTSLKGNALVMERLMRQDILTRYPEDTDLMSNTTDAFASIINNNLNITMKVLTALTVLFAVPTLVMTIWGINVPVPFERQAWGFAAVCGISIILTLFAFVIMRRKNMF